jgi:acetyltransferase-like isoleucine patch superfamily enzyme
MAIGARTTIAPGGQFTQGFRDGRAGRIGIGAHVEIERGVVLNAFGGSISIGNRVYFGPYVAIYGHGGVTIGDHCLISMHSRILSSNHAVPPFGTLVRSQGDVRKPTSIGRDVWLGTGCTVLAGVTIGDGCIVGAGAVVAADLPAGAIAIGVPAKVLKYREGAGP